MKWTVVCKGIHSTLSGPRFFRYHKYGGGGGKLLKIGRHNTVYAHMLALEFFEQNFSFEGARPEKVLKICPFSKMSKSKS